jgi:UDPglucose 6-dehydrogenase
MAIVTVGIIGHGVVGKAVECGFHDKCKIVIYDPIYNKGSIEDVVAVADFIFVSVPTPMKHFRGGPFDSSIIDDVMGKISGACDKHDRYPVVIIKSAVLPSVIKRYLAEYPKVRLVVSPEYLTDKEPLKLFINAELLILGGKRTDTEAVQELFEKYSICAKCEVGHCDAVGAAILKYMENCFLAMKVIFMNQFYDIVKASGTNDSWDHLSKIFHYDSRMGNSHYKVPGPDGDRGYGGKCFCKDLGALIHYAEEIGCNIDLIKTVVDLNLNLYRTNIDWVNR